MTQATGASTPPPIKDDAPLPLSVAIVCRNNERTIARTLDSVRGLAAQIVAVDSGSTDSTISLLESHSAEVIRHQWLGHIKTKQLALDRCIEPWILSLDSDESLEPELQRSIREAVRRNDPSIAGYEVNRKVWWDGAFLNHAWQPEWRLRLVRIGRARWGGYDPHDSLQIAPSANGSAAAPTASSAPTRVARLHGDLRHESFQTMADHLAAQVNHARIAADSYITLGRRASVVNLITSPLSAWLKQMLLRHAWRDGWRGWSAASATAASALMKHLVMLEKQKGNRREAPANFKSEI